MELNKIYCGDCIELLKLAKDINPILTFADPPFNIGYEYETYQDNKEYNKYIDWTKEWMNACYDILKENGSFYIAIGDEYVAEVKMIGKELGLTMRNWIIWNYSFGQNTVKKFGRSHTHILYFVKDPNNYIFNDDDIRTPSARQLIYNDKRADCRGRIPDDVWRYPRVCGTFKERVGWHTCQMPLKLMARIIKTSSNKGDVVLDPFSGSSSTLVAAAVLERKYIGIDIDPKYVKLGQNRIEEATLSGLKDINEKEESGRTEIKKEKGVFEEVTLFDI